MFMGGNFYNQRFFAAGYFFAAEFAGLAVSFFFNPAPFQFKAQALDREKASPGGGGGL